MPPTPPKRKGRPLLIAAAGIAFVSFASNCGPNKPVGNLKAPEPPPSAEPPIEPVGNLRVPTGDEPPPQPPPSAEPPKDDKPHLPVGNLRPPE